MYFTHAFISKFIKNLFFKKGVKGSFSPLDLTNCFSCSSSAFICFSPSSSIVFIYFSNALPMGKYVNLACSITLLWFRGSIFSPVRYSYLSILPYDNTDIFAASLLIFYFNFLSLILSSVVIISFYILSKRLFLKREWLSDARVASITKKEYGFALPFS